MYREDRFVHAIPTNADMKVVRAIDLFNASPHCRTISGVARTLGAPLVTRAPVGDRGQHRHDRRSRGSSRGTATRSTSPTRPRGVRSTGQGAELDELDEPDRAPNAIADEFGALHAAVQPERSR